VESLNAFGTRLLRTPESFILAIGIHQERDGFSGTIKCCIADGIALPHVRRISRATRGLGRVGATLKETVELSLLREKNLSPCTVEGRWPSDRHLANF
jgi:hypothetical protein